MDKNLLRQVVFDQTEHFKVKKGFIKRNLLYNPLSSSKISVISGVRRCGKSTLLKILSEDIVKYFYLNFEDERLLDFQHNDFQQIVELAYEMNGKDLNVYMFDEIQNIKGWEKFVRRLFSEGKKVIVTGSNSKMLSTELATSLTGRYLKTELFPFSFAEYLKYHDIKYSSNLTSVMKGVIKKHFSEYMQLGGFPEVVISKNTDELIQLYQDILINDIIVRFGIKDTKGFRELALYMLSNISSLYSYNNLAKLLNVKSPTTIVKNISYLENSYLFFSLLKYDHSLRKQVRNNRKIYAIDTGIYNAVSFQFSENKGKILENTVLLELKRNGLNIHYYKNDNECDFLVSETNKLIKAIQVTHSLNKENEAREINGLTGAMEKFKIKEGLILTFDQDEKIKVNNHNIIIIPVWKWLLDHHLNN